MRYVQLKVMGLDEGCHPSLCLWQVSQQLNMVQYGVEHILLGKSMDPQKYSWRSHLNDYAPND
jgi:hypothetical protein